MVELSFVDAIGYTLFKVSKEWYEKQTETDPEKLYHLAAADDESELVG